jgi:hypothetical protein
MQLDDNIVNNIIKSLKNNSEEWEIPSGRRACNIFDITHKKSQTTIKLFAKIDGISGNLEDLSVTCKRSHVHLPHNPRVKEISNIVRKIYRDIEKTEEEMESRKINKEFLYWNK